ncbi:hypothetical protein GJR96_17470 [Haloferax sp. MBLA0076]|uniref:Uncharacterized protein n=1 Tax=Haloferax litoreum TaxID=2666140 RepID=A0A6A8GKR7_9EURY|nr:MULTISPECIES: DUF6544 family protein [Haloferax]KAB1189963.1 hypothetical protein Hfx1148_17405 [Haloferax sp. CBA1148]MRX23735.1 hypothetical protein [Haloferax litoreum]
MSPKRLLGVGGIVLLGGVALALASRAQRVASSARLVGELLADRASTPTRTVRFEDIEGLPKPIRRYLEHVLTEGRPYVHTARLHQDGEFRLGDASAPWKPLEATQHYTVEPPGFVWDARIDIVPSVPIRVVDAFVGGEGLLVAKLFSLVPVAEADPSQELDEGELARHLAEMVWFPTAFLPGQGVEWDAVDAHSARATIEYDGTSASVVFHVDDDEITHVTADRWYEMDDGSYELQPWTGYFHDYHEVDGLRVPSSGEVEWNLPDGDLSYWRADIDGVEYEP